MGGIDQETCWPYDKQSEICRGDELPDLLVMRDAKRCHSDFGASIGPLFE